jgi:fused signal recognition particle receptor
MNELEKIDRVVGRRIAGAPHETLLVLDATIGQNAARQLAAFKEVVDVSGIVLTKMDSSACGGIVVALREEYGVPIKLLGTGEGLEDLESFEARAFVEGVLGP